MARTDVTITVVLKYFQLLQHLPVRLRARALVSILHVSVSHKMSNFPSQLTLVMTKPPGDRCDWSGRGRDPARLKSAAGTSPAAVVTVEIATRSRQQKQPRQAAGGQMFRLENHPRRPELPPPSPDFTAPQTEPPMEAWKRRILMALRGSSISMLSLCFLSALTEQEVRSRLTFNS